MKKIAVIAAAAILALALAGCGSSGSSSSASASAASTSAASASSASASASSSSSSVATVKWTQAKTADEAAKAAGVEEFIVPKEGTKLSLGELGKWSYYSADKKAEADCGVAAAGIVIRKAVGSGDNTQGATVTGSGRDFSEASYANEWSVNMDGTDVRCYGKEKGKASKAVWDDGKYSYAILALGQGDNWQDFGLSEDDIAILVKGTKKDQSKQDNKSSQSSQSAQSDQDDQDDQGDQDDQDDQSDQPSSSNLTISKGDAEAAAEGASGGDATDSYQDYVDGHGWVWVVTTNDDNGNSITYYVDNYGNPYNAEFDSNSSTDLSLSEADACAIAEQASGGNATNSYQEQTENHGLCWYVKTEDSNGNVNEYHVDNNGNAFNIEFE